MIILPGVNFNLIEELNTICAQFIRIFRLNFIIPYELEISAENTPWSGRQIYASERKKGKMAFR